MKTLLVVIDEKLADWDDFPLFFLTKYGLPIFKIYKKISEKEVQ